MPINGFYYLSCVCLYFPMILFNSVFSRCVRPIVDYEILLLFKYISYCTKSVGIMLVQCKNPWKLKQYFHNSPEPHPSAYRHIIFGTSTALVLCLPLDVYSWDPPSGKCWFLIIYCMNIHNVQYTLYKSIRSE